MKQFLPFCIRLLKKHPLMLIAAAAAGTGTVLFSTALFALAAWLILFTSTHPGMELIMVPVVGVRFFGIGRAGFRYLERLISHDTAFRILRDLRVACYLELEPRLPDLGRHADRGGLVAMAVSDIEMLQDAILRIILPALIAICIAAGAAVAASLIHPSLAPAFLGTLLVLMAIAYVLWRPRRGLQALAAAENRNLYSEIIENSRGAVETVLNGRVFDRMSRMDSILKREEASARPLGNHSAAGAALAAAAPSIALIATLGTAAALAAEQRIPAILVAVLPLAAASLFEAFVPLFSLLLRMEKSAGAAERIGGTGMAAPADLRPPAAVPAGPALSFENVSFSHDPRLPLISGFSMTLNRGTITALVGRSGCGKSTIVDLACGFIRPNSGSIRLGGIDIAELSAEFLRSHIAVAEQRPFLFNSDIATNLRLASAEATDEELMTALAAVGLRQFVESLPEKLHAPVTELGLRFSGGERQRLSIARALLRKAPILILDEPAAGLDALSERMIIDLLKKLSAERAILLITHRRAAAEEMDVIVPMGVESEGTAGAKSFL